MSLETGAAAAFEPAQRLYESFGFSCCRPFGDYVEDPNSVFMTLRLQEFMLRRDNPLRPAPRPGHRAPPWSAP
jgi:hypothetical protein